MNNNKNVMEQNKIIIYQTEDGQTQIDVRLENETVWLTQAQMAELFEKTPQNITMHIGNAYKEGELDKTSTCKEYLQVQQEGTRMVSRKVKYYDLDVIISVGCNVALSGNQEPFLQRRQQAHCCHAVPLVPQQQRYTLS